ncbi:hypothetical protein DPX16_13352 [Anabarilius grahami]|uniref:Uncharacterized protein n=1 Tax=Anabarilius grahami TaxID=495550 RepID=A0A3N0YN55_ANAGA|nr:hypothetical protein DPX16_13352 [Anabarilius grahami]
MGKPCRAVEWEHKGFHCPTGRGHAASDGSLQLTASDWRATATVEQGACDLNCLTPLTSDGVPAAHSIGQDSPTSGRTGARDSNHLTDRAHAASDVSLQLTASDGCLNHEPGLWLPEARVPTAFGQEGSTSTLKGLGEPMRLGPVTVSEWGAPTAARMGAPSNEWEGFTSSLPGGTDFMPRTKSTHCIQTGEPTIKYGYGVIWT